MISFIILVLHRAGTVREHWFGRTHTWSIWETPYIWYRCGRENAIVFHHIAHITEWLERWKEFNVTSGFISTNRRANNARNERSKRRYYLTFMANQLPWSQCYSIYRTSSNNSIKWSVQCSYQSFALRLGRVVAGYAMTARDREKERGGGGVEKCGRGKTRWNEFSTLPRDRTRRSRTKNDFDSIF